MKKSKMNAPINLQKEHWFSLWSGTKFTIQLGALVVCALFLFNLWGKYTATNVRIDRLEAWRNEWGRFTAQDWEILKKEIEELKKEKADKSDIKIIEVKLANIEAVLLEIKQKIK